MSKSYEAEYALQREMQRQIAAARVSNTTEQFYRRYTSQLEELQRKGATTYIPDEMSRLKSDLDQIRSLLVSDPFEAREISQRVGRYIHDLHGLARAAEQQFNLAIRMQAEARHEKEKDQLNNALNEYYRQIQGIPPSVANFGIKSFQELREEIVNGKVMSVEQVRSRISSISKHAEKQASEWKCCRRASLSENRRRCVSEAAEVIWRKQNRVKEWP